jgi:septum formation protein
MASTVFKNIETLCLASASPRRKELEARLGLPLTVISIPADETYTAQRPRKIAEQISRGKAEAVLKARGVRPGEVILTADTSVWLDGSNGSEPVMLGKPADAADARKMLRALSGKTHRVLTGFTLAYRAGNAAKPRLKSYCVATEVHVAELSDNEIGYYIRSGDPLDKAGAYGIQGAFAVHIDRIRGNYDNVVGLPLAAVYDALKTADNDITKG